MVLSCVIDSRLGNYQFCTYTVNVMCQIHSSLNTLVNGLKQVLRWMFLDLIKTNPATFTADM